ncbi:HERC2 [Symbiodinium sp. CCMP2592]|nr:HERC2 [Symbiodinium sp. CCMP2592]
MLRGMVFSWLVPSALADVSIAAGGHVTCVLSGGRLRCWGQGSLGQLGRWGDPTDLADASLIPPVHLGLGREATQVAVGKEHICARLSDDNVICWGHGPHGQLGRGRATSLLGSQSDDMGDNLVAVDLGTLAALEVVAGGMQSCARLVDGSLRCWGQGLVGSGEIGLAMGEILAVDLEEPVLQVAAGNSHTCALLEAGAVKCWGSDSDDFGQLGWGPGSASLQTELPAVDLGGEALEVAAGRGFACARLATSQVKCWGSGSDGRLGSGSTDNIGDNAQASPALDLGSGRWAQALAAGEDHACALLDDHSVKCWGKNDFGQLGQGHTRSIGDEPGEMGENLQPVDLGSNRHALAVAAGALHSCAILDDYSVKCWGYGAFGQLGNGGTASLGDEPLEMGDALPVSLYTKASSEGLGAQEMHRDPPRPTRFLQASSSCCENSSTKSPCEVLQAYMESVLMTTTTTTLDITFATARMASHEKRIITFCSMGLVATLLLSFIIFICRRTIAKRRARLEKLREDAAIRDMLQSDDDVSKMGSARALAAALEREVAPGPPSLGETLRPEEVPSPTAEPKQLSVPGGRPLSPTPSETHSVRSGPFPPPAKASVPSPRPPPARSPRPGPPRPPGLKLPNYTSEEC